MTPNAIKRLIKQSTKQIIAKKKPNMRTIIIISTIKRGLEPVRVLD